MKKKHETNLVEVLEFLKSKKTYLKEHYGVINIGLFGSFSRKDNQTNSDIDILVELKEQKFSFWANLKIYLEEKLNSEIDLIIKAPYLKKRFLDRIEKEIKYV